MPEEKKLEIEIFQGIKADTAVISNKDSKLHDLEFLLDNPRRITEDRSFDDIRGFIAYTNDYKKSNTAAFIGKEEIKVVIDYHTKDSAEWCSHAVDFQLVVSDYLKPWLATEAKSMDQREFMQFLMLNSLVIASPSHSEVLTFTKELKVIKASQTDSRVGNGEYEINFTESSTVLSAGAKKVEIIEDIVIKPQIYKGIELTGEFNIKIFVVADGAKVYFRFHIVNKEQVLDKIAEQLQTKLQKDLEGVKIYIG